MGDSFADDLVALLPRLKRVAMALCRTPDVADDLVQLTVERAFAARDRFDPATRLQPWLFRILRNAWIDMVRRSRIRGVEVDVDGTPDAAQVDGARGIESRVMLSEVQALMAGLADDHRIVLHLVCVEELSYAEAAEVLGVPRGTVMSRMSRARLALARALGIE